MIFKRPNSWFYLKFKTSVYKLLENLECNSFFILSAALILCALSGEWTLSGVGENLMTGLQYPDRRLTLTTHKHIHTLIQIDSI